MRIRNRALLATGAALALSVSMLAATLGAASATTPPPDPARNCSFTALVTFASPGISKYGSLSTSKISTTTSTGSTYNCGADGNTTTPDLNIVAKATSKCDKKVVGQQDNKNAAPSSNPNCTSGNGGKYVYDSALGFAQAGTGTLQKAVKKTTITIHGVTYLLKTTSVAAIAPGGSCGGEVGFLINGQVKQPKQDKGQPSTLKACLGHDTGPGTTGSFSADLINELGANTGSPTIATTTVDPASSTLHIG